MANVISPAGCVTRRCWHNTVTAWWQMTGSTFSVAYTEDITYTSTQWRSSKALWKFQSIPGEEGYSPRMCMPLLGQCRETLTLISTHFGSNPIREAQELASLEFCDFYWSFMEFGDFFLENLMIFIEIAGILSEFQNHFVKNHKFLPKVANSGEVSLLGFSVSYPL